MVGFMIGEGELEQLQASVDGSVDGAEPAGEGMDEADAAAGNATGTIGDLIVNVAGSHHGLGAAAKITLLSRRRSIRKRFVVGQFSPQDQRHLKSSAAGCWRKQILHSILKCRGISRSSDFSSAGDGRLRWLRLGGHPNRSW